MKKNTLFLLLRLLKEEFGMRDAAVARECGMNKTAVCRIGQGYDLKKSGHDDAFRRLAECLYGRACGAAGGVGRLIESLLRCYSSLPMQIVRKLLCGDAEHFCGSNS